MINIVVCAIVDVLCAVLGHDIDFDSKWIATAMMRWRITLDRCIDLELDSFGICLLFDFDAELWQESKGNGDWCARASFQSGNYY